MNGYEARELEIEKELVGLERYVVMADEMQCDCYDVRREILDLKHELWQSRL